MNTRQNKGWKAKFNKVNSFVFANSMLICWTDEIFEKSFAYKREVGMDDFCDKLRVEFRTDGQFSNFDEKSVVVNAS